MLKPLNRSTIGAVPSRPVKVIQFGGGNFLRGFADWIIDVMNERTDFNGAIQIIQSISQETGQVINEQEGLYHVVINGIKNNKPSSEIRLITSVIGAVSPDKDFSAFIKLAENPDLEFIISNTTEAGITFNENDRSHDSLPASFPGKLTVLLYHRFQFFNGNKEKALIIIPCELISRNGEELKKIVLQYIQLWKLPLEFKQWIECNSFCNTLVDRIVPGFPKETIDEIKQSIGFDDKLVVMAEPFHLWVIEGPAIVREHFPADKAGLDVKFVEDHEPYRVRKVRILNGAHTALVPLAYLYGLRTVRESIENEFTGNFIKKAIYKEIIPTLDLPQEELLQFADDVVQRFQNPYIKHELITISLNSISKFKIRVIPSILEYLKRNKKLPKRLLYSLAAIIRFYKGEWNGSLIPLNDTPEVINFFKEVWKQDNLESIVAQVLSNATLWGIDLTKVEGMKETITRYLTFIHNQMLTKIEGELTN
jgi:tagaturonate reductase